MTDLSVIVPFHDVGAYASQTLASLRRSAAAGIEYVLVDDASTDATREILAAGVDGLPGARLIRLEDNVGLAAARNVGLDAATGEHIAFLDGDDFVAPGHYPELVRTIRRLGCEMVRTDHVRVVGTKRTVARITHPTRGRVGSPREAILPVNRATSVDAPYAWAGIFHRSLLDRGLLHFDPRLRTCEDRPWIWKLHLRASSFAVVDHLGVFYRRDVTNSLSTIRDRRQFWFVPAFDSLLTEIRADRDAERLMPKAVHSYLTVIAHHHSTRDHYPGPLRPELDRVCRAAARGIGQADVERGLRTLDSDRARAVRRLLV
jgi:glycosyltransferase involved in cell wall biosynthesis